MLEPSLDGISEQKSLNIPYQNEQQSTSAYASAETSPNPSISSSLSLQSLKSNLATNGEDSIRSKLSPSASISSLLGNKIEASLTMHQISLDDPSIVVSNNKPVIGHPLADLSGPVKVVPSSTSSNALDKLLRQGEFSSLNNQYQSLPPNILFENAKNVSQNKELPSDSTQTIQDLVTTTVKQLIENTVKSSIEEITKEMEQEKNLPKVSNGTNLMPHLFPASNSILKSTVSSSSPNPECSPFKLLINELPSSNMTKSPNNSTTILASTLSPNGSTINEAVAIFKSESKVNKDDKLIEKLAGLNHKEHEKADPILSASTKPTESAKSTLPVLTKTLSHMENLNTSPSKAKLNIPTSHSTMNVPASSQEFCMNLNLNLAAAAALNAAAPIVVCDNSKLNTSPKESQQQQNQLSTEHQRFTSNASTSSIHNDLKMILEESKGQVSPKSDNEARENKKLDSCTKEAQKSSDEKKDAPKPQREKTHKHKSSNNKSKTENQNKSKENQSTKSNTDLSKSGDLMNLINLMKTISENKGKPNTDENQSSRYRYSKEFLTQIRNERSKFIENIYPEIFKAYCYCMNGKYWDPEKYFDIIQYSGEYDRLQQQYQPHNNQNNNKTLKKLNNSNNKKKPNSKAQKLVEDGLNLKENLVSPLVNLGLVKQEDLENKQHADKVLLNLLKKSNELKQEQTPRAISLMDMLNNNKKENNKNILNELFNNQNKQKPQVVTSLTTTTTTRHHPVVLTAQELELSQMNKPENRIFSVLNQTPDLHNRLISQSLSPSSCSSNSCTSECSDTSNTEMNNSSEAYKQLIKNLSNHPLCTPPSSNRVTSLDNVLLKLQQNKNENDLLASLGNGQNVSKDGTNLLKQLLNLNSDNLEQNQDDKKPKHKRNHHHHHRHHHHHNKTKTIDANKLFVESTTTTTTTTTITKTQFPSINPHEKPFQNYKPDQTNSSSSFENLISKITKQPVVAETVKSEKLNEQQHFNSLLNKIMPVQQTVQKDDNNILKWFSGINLNNNQQAKQNFSAKTLSEIELMSGHFP